MDPGTGDPCTFLVSQPRPLFFFYIGSEKGSGQMVTTELGVKLVTSANNVIEDHVCWIFVAWTKTWSVVCAVLSVPVACWQCNKGVVSLYKRFICLCLTPCTR